MEKYEYAIKKFIEKKQYITNEQVLGIVLYGSFTTGYNHNKSDIDLHIIMKDNVEVLIRGVELHDGYKIEYFEKPIHDLYESADNDFLIQNNALLPIIGHGKILFDRNGEILKLQNYILKKYSEPLPKLTGDDAKEMAFIIENRITQLKMMFENNSPYFNHNYHLLLEKIRKFYARICGCADIPVTKVYKIYTDEAYRESFCKSIIPEPKFIKLYFDAVLYEGANNQKMNYIYELYEYSTKNLNINPNDYRIKIKSRNNPFNKNHE